MKKPGRTFYLFVVIILEGYVVLSTELLAIRETIPFIGSGTDTVSIIIAAVLMPLAFGYYAGGRFRPRFKNGRYFGVRRKLIFNIIVALSILVVGLSYALLSAFFLGLAWIGIENRLITASLYSLLFLIGPVYLLGQTIPLISNYFSKEKMAQITGRILFFSTMGSFMGAVFSTLVLMSTIGVHNTAALVFIILAGLVILLSKKKTSETVILTCALAACGIAINSQSVMDVFHIVENNKYNTIVVFEQNGERHLLMNNNSSSMLSDKGRKHPYTEFAEQIAIQPILKSDPPKEILVIGAGAFTFGFRDTNNKYDYLDIDGSLKEISETYILKEKLTPNKKFIPLEVRAYFIKSEKKYDVIFLDAYLGDLTLPEHLVTREFFVQVRDHLKPGGIVMANFITSPNFLTPFSRNIDNTFRNVFPNISRYVIYNDYMPWNQDPIVNQNVIYIYRDTPDAGPGKIYTDNKNSVFFDKPHTRKSGLSRARLTPSGLETPKEDAPEH